MLAMSWAYVRYGTTSPLVRSAFVAVQAAVAALIVRAVHRIGDHAVTNPWLWAIALGAFGVQLLGAHFAPTLAVGGADYALVQRGQRGWAGALGAVGLVLLVGSALLLSGGGPVLEAGTAPDAVTRSVSLAALFLSGLKAGLLTFGGAYTAIPFIRGDSVGQGWLTDGQFLDGLALSGVLPAPLIIFSTFVGYAAGGPAGALAMTAGIFLPAFAFSLLFFDRLEAVVENKSLRTVLEGVAAGVVGLIAATTVELASAVVGRLPSLLPGLLIFAAALAVLHLWKAKTNVVAVILGGAAAGWLAYGL